MDPADLMKLAPEVYDEENLEIVHVGSFWTTREGVKVRIRDMGDNHLMNTIRMLRGKSPIGTQFHCTKARRSDWLNVMANEAYRRGLSVPLPDDHDPEHE